MILEYLDPTVVVTPVVSPIVSPPRLLCFRRSGGLWMDCYNICTSVDGRRFGLVDHGLMVDNVLDGPICRYVGVTTYCYPVDDRLRGVDMSTEVRILRQPRIGGLTCGFYSDHRRSKPGADMDCCTSTPSDCLFGDVARWCLQDVILPSYWNICTSERCKYSREHKHLHFVKRVLVAGSDSHVLDARFSDH